MDKIIGKNIADLSNLCKLSEIFETSIDKLMGNIVKSGKPKNFIGVDGGATKTEFILFTDSGEIIKRIVLGGCNPNAVKKYLMNMQKVLQS